MSQRIVKNEQGFVLVAAMSALVVLSMIGIAAMNTSNVERNIAHNINIAEKTFYGSDGGTEAGIEMIEWNLSCPLGFNNLPGASANFDSDPTELYQIGGLEIADSRFAYDSDMTELPWDPTVPDLCPDENPANCLPAATAITGQYVPSDGARSIRIPEDMNNPRDNPQIPLPNNPHTNIAIFGATSLAAGSAVQMAAGYEGKGKSAAGGGAVINYNVFSQTFGINNAEAIIRLGWRHLVGQEGECKPYK